MRIPALQAIQSAVVALAIALTATPPASADQLRWPRASELPAPAPQPKAPPAVLARAPSADGARRVDGRRRADGGCGPDRMCVVCVAACDGTPPIVLHSMPPQPLGEIAIASTENDSDGIAPNAPKYARAAWAGITCGTSGGCSVSGVSAPRRTDIDIRVTFFRPYFGDGGSTSHYIDR